ncbi:MAG: chromosomal replication initiator protein DnaA [Deltaproteobacteria bacterium]|jgi:chromosomal replication initiator protein|nr:chromosomal replication initiator protein DnaA [Deltaproteobacteria bacterium]
MISIGNVSPEATGLILATIWPKAKARLAETIAQSAFRVWIDPLRPNVVDGPTLQLETPNHFFLTFVRDNYRPQICQAVAAQCQESGFGGLAVDFAESEVPVLPFAAEATETAPPPGWSEMCRAGRLMFNPRFTFENFIVGDPNSLAFEAAKAFAAGQKLGAGILYITSDHGLGKSHLSQALGQCYLDGKPGGRVRYLTCEDFTNEMVMAIKSQTTEAFKSKYRLNCDVLMLEEMTFLAGKSKIQDELSFTLDQLLNQGKMIVLTSTAEPQRIPKLAQSLKSRLCSALVAPIGPPDFETRMGILADRALKLGLRVPRPILELFAGAVKNDVRRLESCLTTLEAKSRLLTKAVDMDMALETISFISETAADALALTKLVKVVCRAFNLDEEELRSKSRRRNLAEARSVGMCLARRLTDHTYEEIGQAFGRSHSTTLHAINKIEGLLPHDPKLKGRIEYITAQLSQEI